MANYIKCDSISQKSFCQATDLPPQTRLHTQLRYFPLELSQERRPPGVTYGAPLNISIRAWMLNQAWGSPLFNLPILDQHLRESVWPSCLENYPIRRDTLHGKCFLNGAVCARERVWA